MDRITHHHRASGTGKASLRDIVAAVRQKGVEAVHEHTAETPDIVVDPEAVAGIIANTPDEAKERQVAEVEVDLQASDMDSLLQASMPGLLEDAELTEEERFLMKRKAARESLRRRDDR